MQYDPRFCSQKRCRDFAGGSCRCTSRCCMPPNATAVPVLGYMHEETWVSCVVKHYASPIPSYQAEAEFPVRSKSSPLGMLMLGLLALVGIISGCGGYFPSEHLRGAFIWGRPCLTDSSLSHIASSAQSRSDIHVDEKFCVVLTLCGS